MSPPYNVAYLVKILCREIGVERRITPRSLRHSAITIALDAGLELRDVQDFARREDPKTTRGYDRARNQLNRHATYAIAQCLAGGTDSPLASSAARRRPTDAAVKGRPSAYGGDVTVYGTVPYERGGCDGHADPPF